jgi:hypothetical protein
MGELAVWGAVATGGAAARVAPRVISKVGPIVATSGSLFARDTGILNRNPLVRLGVGWNDDVGSEVFRVVIGSRGLPIWKHIDLFKIGGD